MDALGVLGHGFTPRSATKEERRAKEDKSMI